MRPDQLINTYSGTLRPNIAGFSAGDIVVWRDADRKAVPVSSVIKIPKTEKGQGLLIYVLFLLFVVMVVIVFMQALNPGAVSNTSCFVILSRSLDRSISDCAVIYPYTMDIV